MKDNNVYEVDYKPSTMAVYIAEAMEKKGGKISEKELQVGDFLYNHQGELVGFYHGNNYIVKLKK